MLKPGTTIDEHIIYFEHGSAGFHCPWHRIVIESAAKAIRSVSAQVRIIAHADTSGAAEQNAALSHMRGRAVRNALVQLGIDREAITIEAHGESQPAVATGDGVSEPLNRRAVITWTNR